ncbi:MAG: monovalent cation/H(+) antiporter subunit G [Caldilineaceae bacterium]|nr:monovalent cation/H(+) antiporter subunit G [Caldilineaceae bacterium]MDE0339805.1 monovalent cation/H(+) antiporter subunit G [Caldilineaceae bacterium]
MDSTTVKLLVVALAAVGTIFLLISAVGMLRLPDVLTRMHAAGIAATLGITCLLLATGLHFLAEGQMLRMVALIILFFVTAPIATTTMARAAYRTSRSDQFLLLHDDLAAISPTVGSEGQDEPVAAQD